MIETNIKIYSNLYPICQIWLEGSISFREVGNYTAFSTKTNCLQKPRLQETIWAHKIS